MRTIARVCVSFQQNPRPFFSESVYSKFFVKTLFALFVLHTRGKREKKDQCRSVSFTSMFSENNDGEESKLGSFVTARETRENSRHERMSENSVTFFHLRYDKSRSKS